MADLEDEARRFYALIYTDEDGKEKSVWYSDRETAEQAKRKLNRECQIRTVDL